MERTVWCRVCAGLGGWYRDNFRPTRERGAIIMICPMCDGHGSYAPIPNL